MHLHPTIRCITMPRLLAVQPDEGLQPLLEELGRRGFTVDDDPGSGTDPCRYDVVLVSSAGEPPAPDGEGPIRILSSWFDGDAVQWASRIARMADERCRRRLLSCVLETSPDLEAWIGTDGDCQYISPSCEDLTGYGPEAYVADPALLVRCGHPDDQDRLRASIFGDGTVAQTFCCRVVTRSGEVRRIVHRSIPCQDEAGNPIGVRVHQQRAPDEDPAQEIQRLRALLGQTEGDRALLTAVIESLPVGVIAMGGAGELLVANPAAVPYLEQVRGAPLPAEAYLGHYRELERQLRGPDGLPQYLHLTAGPLARTGHRIFGAVGAVQDITHTRASAQARRRELAEAKQQVWRLEGANADLSLRIEALESHLDEIARSTPVPADSPGGTADPPADECATILAPIDGTAILAAVPDQVWVLDTDLRCRYVNPTGAAAARHRANHLVGRPWSEVRLASGLVREIARKSSSVLVEGVERAGVWTDGVEGIPQIYHYAVRRIVDQDGAPGALVTIRDGALLRRHVEGLSRTVARQERPHAILHAILDQIPVGVVIAVVPSGRVIFRNPGFVEIWGETAPSPTGLDEYDVWTGLRKGGSPYDPQDWPLTRAVRAGERVRDEEIEVVRDDGSRNVYSVCAGPILDEDGTTYAAAATFIDITDRRTAEDAVLAREERLRLAAESIPQIFAIYDRAGRYVFVNEAGARFVGREAEDLVGRTDEEIFGLRGAPGWSGLVRQTIGTLTESGGEFRVNGADGSERLVVAFCMPLLQRDGACGEVLLIGNDVTGERRAAAALERYASELARSNDELQQFAYVASHDLQEPLRSIVSFVQLLERRYRGRLDDDADEMIGYIAEGGSRMQVLINDLLAFSRVATRGRPFGRLPLDDAVRDAVLDLRSVIAEGGAEVRYGDLPMVWGDRGQIVQVFENLISNAIKFRRPDAPPEVTVSAVRDRRMWHVMVADNGIGIEAEYYDRIFVIFQRLHTRDVYPGTGIGLAIVKKIVERHGGRVWVDSVPGEGSVFHLTLPVVPQGGEWEPSAAADGSGLSVPF
ncbi:MAG: PAS domain-containing protein [Methanospirillum sp.]